MMNDKQNRLYTVVDIVVECCSYELDCGNTATREMVLGNCKTENAVWTRCLLAKQIAFLGYSTGTIAMLLGRTPAAVRNMLKTADNLHDTSCAYRIAEAQVILKCRGIFNE